MWGDEGERQSFQNRWSGGIDHCIACLKERVQEMHRILKPTGSIMILCVINLLDKKGEQKQKFTAGEYKIAVKVVDNEGLENLEIIKLKNNGALKVISSY